jgi:hypothetical protein
VTHDEAVNEALLAVSRLGHRAWRREVGNFYDARVIKTAIGHLFSGRPREAAAVLRRAKPHKIGVPGEADVQGILSGGWALAVEVKTGAAQRREGQVRWAQMFQTMGGCYVLARWNDREDGSATLAKEIGRFLSEQPATPK